MQHYKPQIPPCAFSTTWIGIAAWENSAANKPMLPRKAPAQETGKSSRAYSPRVRREHPLQSRGHEEMQSLLHTTGRVKALPSEDTSSKFCSITSRYRHLWASSRRRHSSLEKYRAMSAKATPTCHNGDKWMKSCLSENCDITSYKSFPPCISSRDPQFNVDIRPWGQRWLLSLHSPINYC